jgi:DNA-binding FadR family transcriptional regulator
VAGEAPRLYAAEELALRIERHIVSSHLAPGARLGTKAEIRDRYEFAGGTVNEAVILLETRGMVEARPGPGGGLFVAAPAPRARLDLLLRELLADAPSPADCLDLRSALEPALWLDAARHCQEADAAELREILAATRADGGRDGPRPDGLRLHRRIAEMTANRLLRIVYLATLNLLEEAEAPVSGPSPSGTGAPTAADEELVEAIIDGRLPTSRRPSRR